MGTGTLPPYLVINTSKEVIFYMPKQSDAEQEISKWMEELDLSNYKGMVINSKCIFNRLKNKNCN
tara:strand:+ start:201 stop:395 length:195 start_codon:yes stop_codon:yes gene_type:complete